MSNPLLNPIGPTRQFTAPLGANLDARKARPGFSLAAGGPALTSNAAHDTADRDPVRPVRLSWNTDGDVVLRYYLGVCPEGVGVGSEMYYDDTITALAGTSLDVSPDVIVNAGTTANFGLAWPSR